MNIKVAQVIGLNTDQKAAQVISTPGGENAFFAVLDLSCDDAFTKGRQILSELSDYYFDFEGTPAEKLKACFERAKDKFSQEEHSLLMASISGKILYLILSGDMEAYLKRDDKLSSLSAVGTQGQLISGFLQSQDRLLFSTKSLTAFLGEDLEKSLNLPLDSFEEELSDRIGASHLENQGLAALSAELEEESESQQDLKENHIEKLEEESTDSWQEQTMYESGAKLTVGLKKIASAFKNILKFIPKGGKSKLILAVALIVILGLGIGYKVVKTKNAQKEAQFRQILQQSKDDFNAAKGLATLNPSDAKSKLDSAKDKINKAISLRAKNSEALDFKKQIESESDSILQQSQVSDFPQFLELDLIKKNFRAQNLSLSSGKLLILDPAVKTLVIIDIAKKSNQTLAGSEQLGEAKYASLNGELAFVYSSDKGILKIDSTNQKVTTVSKPDKEWGEIKEIYAFASNIYLLDSKNNMIWKYLPAADGYSSKREYLTKDTKMDFSDAQRMQIESSVYVLKSGGEIFRYTKGNKDNFGFEGLPSNIKDPKNFFVSSDTDNLYVLDSGNSRLLTLSKTGVYKSQITGSKFASASDLVVDEKGKKVYLLEEGKIYSIDLK